MEDGINRFEEAGRDLGDLQVSGLHNWEDPPKVVTFAIIKGTGVFWGMVLALDQSR